MFMRILRGVVNQERIFSCAAGVANYWQPRSQSNSKQRCSPGKGMRSRARTPASAWVQKLRFPVCPKDTANTGGPAGPQTNSVPSERQVGVLRGLNIQCGDELSLPSFSARRKAQLRVPLRVDAREGRIPSSNRRCGRGAVGSSSAQPGGLVPSARDGL